MKPLHRHYFSTQIIMLVIIVLGISFVVGSTFYYGVSINTFIIPIGLSLLFYFMGYRLSKVYFDGDHIVIKRFSKSQKIPLRNLERLVEIPFSTPRIFKLEYEHDNSVRVVYFCVGWAHSDFSESGYYSEYKKLLGLNENVESSNQNQIDR